MKPIIIIKEKTANGKFEFTEKELNELIEQAYNQGVADGRPKATLPQSQYDRPEDGILYRNINGGENDKSPNYSHDIYGYPVPYCISTESDPKDNPAVPNTEFNDLVYRGGEHKVKFPKQGEPIPCNLNQTSSNPNPGSITAWNMTTSNQPNKDTYKGEQSR